MKKNNIEWLSPSIEDGFSEYRDQAFLDLLGIRLEKKKLKDFWPSRGLQWDALGRIKDKVYFLVEAKAHAHAMRRAILIIGSSEICHFLTDCNSY